MKTFPLTNNGGDWKEILNDKNYLDFNTIHFE